ncbi:MAG: hypothetical protein U9R60_12910, partial [Bacteroidota bacterium]|nr:hypothetical protein [Bacteroidota bacterium]
IKHNEPFSDSCLGVSEGVPEEYIEYEKIGESDGTFQPSLSKISKLPFNLNNPITVFTNYDLFYSHAWHTEYMSVSVDANGLCSGDCTLGQLNMRTGVWEEDISWTNIPNADGQNAKIEIVIQYTKAEEPCTGVVVVPWHVMGVGG